MGTLLLSFQCSIYFFKLWYSWCILSLHFRSRMKTNSQAKSENKKETNSEKVSQEIRHTISQEVSQEMWHLPQDLVRLPLPPSNVQEFLELRWCFKLWWCLNCVASFFLCWSMASFFLGFEKLAPVCSIWEEGKCQNQMECDEINTKTNEISYKIKTNERRENVERKQKLWNLNTTINREPPCLTYFISLFARVQQ